MKKKITSIILISVIILGSSIWGFCDGKNLSKQEIEKIIEEVSTKRGIPSVILKSIAKIESSLTQFTRDGKPRTSNRGTYIGIMQVDKNSGYNVDRLKNDLTYNIESGADLLLRKWKTANDKMAQIGNMDPNILEHWYFTLWSYNGLLDRNNPNVNSKTYQDKIYEIALKDYGQKITPIKKNHMPSRGWPKRDIKIPTPEDHHIGDILKYVPGDKVKLDGKDILVLYDKPKGKNIGGVKGNLIMTITEGPVLKDGFYFYKVKVEKDSRIGWVYGNWIYPILEN